ncbi:MAG: hypothetical protein RLZZ618_3075 [Pseudomonadota bacterium]|jgi:cellulose synthase/poly-beta-1,6-N-acetylglucosamine synthase-like glycosyltransferase
METLFWLSTLLLVYTYAGYPALIFALSRLKPAETRAPDPAAWPDITVVMAAYNERSRIERKLNDLRTHGYPGVLKIIVVSDGSTDGTSEWLATQADVRLLSFAERHGKPHALNRALEMVDTPIVVFNDVRQVLDAYALQLLVARLLQPGIGAVSGELAHFDPQTRTAASIGLYWRYEKWIRAAESRFHATVGATGALYAIRREDFVTLAEDAILDDFELPMEIVRSGKRVVFESGAILFDELQTDIGGERKRKVRTLTGNYQAMARHPWMFSPRQNPVWLQFISHKVLRLVAPYAMVLTLLASLALARHLAFFSFVALVQLAFYGAAVLGIVLPALRSSRLISFAAVFVELNAAAVMAFYRYVSGRVEVRWEKT